MVRLVLLGRGWDGVIIHQGQLRTTCSEGINSQKAFFAVSLGLFKPTERFAANRQQCAWHHKNGKQKIRSVRNGANAICVVELLLHGVHLFVFKLVSFYDPEVHLNSNCSKTDYSLQEAVIPQLYKIFINAKTKRKFHFAQQLIWCRSTKPSDPIVKLTY